MQRRKSGRVSSRLARPAALLGLYELQCAEAIERAVDEEDLHRHVRLDVGLADAGTLRAGELRNRLLSTRTMSSSTSAFMGPRP